MKFPLHSSVIDLKAVLAEIDACEDPRQSLSVVEETITKLSAEGAQVPEEIVRLRSALQIDLVHQSQGR